MLVTLLSLYLAQDVSLPVWLAGVLGLTPTSVLVLLWWRVSTLERHLDRFREEHREDLRSVWKAIENARRP